MVDPDPRLPHHHGVDRRSFLLTSLTGALTVPLSAEGQQTEKTSRIGILRLGEPPDRFVEALRRGLKDLGYVEGRNIVIEYRWAGGEAKRLRALAAELVQLKVDVVVAGGTDVIHIVKNATRAIPIVMAVSTDPVGSGIVESLARPGGNITGFASQNNELPGKWLEVLRELLPKMSHVVAIWDPDRDVGQLKVLRTGADAIGVLLHVSTVRNADDLGLAFAEADRRRADAAVVMGSPLMFVHRNRLATLAARHRLPTIYHQREFVVGAGGLISYAADFDDLWRRAAASVDKILKGARPADLPVEQPTKFELVINLKTAKALGLTIPPSLLLRADQVIE